MSDLLTEVLALNAASSAADAAESSKAAQNAAEERLESSGHNPFISFQDHDVETVGGGFFKTGQEKLSTDTKKVSVKKTDIAFLAESKDDFGTTYTEIHLEDRCDLPYSIILVADSLENVQTYINNF